MPSDFDYDAFLARGRQWRQLLPEGRYGWPLHDWDAMNYGSGSRATEPPLIGYCVYWKRSAGLTTTLLLADGLDSTPENVQRLRVAERDDENENIDGDTSGRLAHIVDNPAKYAGSYGMFTGRCGFCGRKLTDRASVERGIGPDCLAKLAVTK